MHLILIQCSAKYKAKITKLNAANCNFCLTNSPKPQKDTNIRFFLSLDLLASVVRLKEESSRVAGYANRFSYYLSHLFFFALICIFNIFCPGLHHLVKVALRG